MNFKTLWQNIEPIILDFLQTINNQQLCELTKASTYFHTLWSLDICTINAAKLMSAVQAYLGRQKTFVCLFLFQGRVFLSLLLLLGLLKPGANVIKLFTAVIYCHSMVISSFCVIKLYYLGNYHGMAVNYDGIKLFYNIGQKSLL